MSPFRCHFFVCTNARPPCAKASCGPQDANQVLMMLREEVEKRGLDNEIKVTASGCLGPCEEGPVMVVYPEGVWYQKVGPSDVSEIVESHMVGGVPVKRLLYDWPESFTR